MKKAFLSTSTAQLRTKLWLLAGLAVVLAVHHAVLGYVFPSIQAPTGTAWWSVVFTFSLSICLGLALLVWLHRTMTLPVNQPMRDMDSALARSNLMQSAMHPALKLLSNGITQQQNELDNLARELEGVASDGKSRSVAARLRELRDDMAARAHIAHTLILSNETIAARQEEMRNALTQLQALLHGETLRDLDSKLHHESTPAAQDTGSTLSSPIWGQTPKQAFTWPKETDRSLLENFRIKQPGNDRFKLN